jgi:hypothetical protein
MWMGLKRRNRVQAFLWTLTLGAFVPMIVFCIPNVGLHLGLLAWARTRLLRELRRVASGESSAPAPLLGRRLAPRSAVPPVIGQHREA